MKPQAQKAEFIQLRAEGKSYAAIAGALHISKSTCTAWDKELAGAIAELKQAQLEELYNAYYVTREARIKALGETLQRINAAIEEADLRDIPPEKLLDLKLKYAAALKEEYIGPAPFTFTGNIEPKEIMLYIGSLFNRLSAGEITPQQAGTLSAAITKGLILYDKAETKAAAEELIGPQVHIYLPDNGRDPGLKDRAEYMSEGKDGPEYLIKANKGKAGKIRGREQWPKVKK